MTTNTDKKMGKAIVSEADMIIKERRNEITFFKEQLESKIDAIITKISKERFGSWDLWDDITKWVEDNITSKLDGLLEDIVNGIGTFMEPVISGFEWIKNGLVGGLDSAGKSVMGTLNTIGNELKGVADWAWDGMTETLGNVKTNLFSFADSAMGALMKAWNKMLDGFDWVQDNIVSGIGDLVGGIGPALTSVVDYIVGMVDVVINLSTGWFDIMKDAMESAIQKAQKSSIDTLKAGMGFKV